MIERYREMQERRKAGDDPEVGFTLIELLIVIIVLGILAAIVIFSLTGVTGQSKLLRATPTPRRLRQQSPRTRPRTTRSDPDSRLTVDLTPRRTWAVPACGADGHDDSNGYQISLGATAGVKWT